MSEGKNHIKMFSVIAPFYNIAFRSQLENYRKLLKENSWRLADKIESAIDIGCGTGAFARALSELGIEVTAVDASDKMVRIARRNLAGTGVRIVRADFFEDLPFEDNSFDLLVASYVLHGHKIDGRIRFYGETKRICKKELLLHEFFPNKNPLVSFVEFLERSDYRNFVSTAYEELKRFNPVVYRVRLSATSGWYICRCK